MPTQIHSFTFVSPSVADGGETDIILEYTASPVAGDVVLHSNELVCDPASFASIAGTVRVRRTVVISLQPGVDPGYRYLTVEIGHARDSAMIEVTP